MICQIGDPQKMDAVLIIDQAYIDLVREGQKVRVLLEAYTGKAYETTVKEIASTEVKCLASCSVMRPAPQPISTHLPAATP